MIWVSEIPHWTGSDPIGDSGYNPLLSRYTVIISKPVFRSAPGITTWRNIIHPVYNTAGCNSTVTSMEFPFLCQWNCCNVTWPSNHTIWNDYTKWSVTSKIVSLTSSPWWRLTCYNQTWTKRKFWCLWTKASKSHYHEQNQNRFNRSTVE